MPISSLEQVAISDPYTNIDINPDPAVTLLVPTDPQSFDATETVAEIKDSGRRGIDAMDFSVYRGVNITDITWSGLVQFHKGDAVPTPIGRLLKEMLITQDVKPAANAKIHYLKMGTAAHVGSIRSYLALEHWVGNLKAGEGAIADPSLSSRKFLGCRPTELTISFNTGEGALAYSVTMQGRGAKLIEKTNLIDSSIDLVAGWQGGMSLSEGRSLSAVTPAAPAVTLAGYNSARLISGEWTFRRSGKPVYTLRNRREFTSYTMGPLEVMFNGMFEFESDKEYKIFSSNDDFITQFGTLFQVSDDLQFGIGANKMSWFAQPARVDTSEEYVKLQISGRALYDASPNSGMFSSKDMTAAMIADRKTQRGPVEVYIKDNFTGNY